MAINFCCSHVKTKIHSPAVSCEGYDLSNLLSNDPLHREKGFLAEGFIKPPVSIFVDFFCYVNISHVLVWTEVGRQKSDGLELYVKTGSAAEKGESSHSSQGHGGESIVRIGSCRLKNESGLMLRKYTYRTEPIVPSNFLVKNFNSSSRFAVQNASSLEIKIYSTANSTVPALKRIEIWGNPSHSCSKEVRKMISDLWNRANSIVDRQPPDIKQADKKLKEEDSKPTSVENENSVPDEFLDPITCEIMAIPMTLPSGKVIDLSTLEKFNDVESTWGRAPCDPFTGISFTKTRFAIPDSALKSRIDQFLVENGHLKQFKGVGRTVGHANLNHSILIGKTSEVELAKKHLSDSSIPSLGISAFKTHNSSSVFKDGISHSQSTSRDHGKESLSGKNENCDSENLNDQNRTNVKRKSCEQAVDTSKKMKTSSFLSLKDHEDMLEDTLDSAIGSVLSGLPSFLKSSAQPSVSKDRDSERHACKECNSVSCLFSLPCEHLLCRSCLVKKSSEKNEHMKCITCKLSFNSGDVKRFHNI
ncbi:hypothetical protein J437_LFUL004005 [Ladona fulva]|uniref:RING finger protein 37 n=1 Tax=Ladona fulva TaxID=123851 RepID=A0A8K0JYF2_LADFU|nr:hypothetical protein J437_LFUL004005 [Ladona fulva]